MKEFNLELAKQLTQDAEANEFSVDFDELWQWCGYSRKDSAKRTLKSRFFVDMDYVEALHNPVEHDNHEGFSLHEKSSATQTMKIWVTPDCAKKFGMLAQTKEGDNVRNYFVKAEKELRRSMKENPVAHLEYMRAVLDEQIQQGYNLQLTKETVEEQQAKLNEHENVLEQHQETIDTTANELESVKQKLESYRSNPNFQNAKFTINQFCRIKGLEPDAGNSRSAGRKLTKLCTILEIDFNVLGAGRSNEYPHWLLEAVIESANDFSMPIEDFVRRCLQCYIED